MRLLHLVGNGLAQFVVKPAALAGGKGEGCLPGAEPVVPRHEAHGQCGDQPKDDESFANGIVFHALLIASGPGDVGGDGAACVAYAAA